MENLSTLVAVLIALSVASERLVEIIKGFSSWLNDKKDDPNKERLRKVSLQLLAVLAGLITAILTRPAIQQVLPQWTQFPEVFALGLLASGGSGFWNSFNSYVLELKNLQKAIAKKEGEVT